MLRKLAPGTTLSGALLLGLAVWLVPSIAQGATKPTAKTVTYSYYTVTSQGGPLENNTGLIMSASCKSGDHATGGGASLQDPGSPGNQTLSLPGTVYDSQPVGSPPTGWQAGYYNSSGSPASVEAYVVCVHKSG